MARPWELDEVLLGPCDDWFPAAAGLQGRGLSRLSRLIRERRDLAAELEESPACVIEELDDLRVFSPLLRDVWVPSSD